MASSGSPTGFVVDDELRVIQFVGRTAQLVELAPGDATLHLPSLIRPRLRAIALEALGQARHSGRSVVRPGLVLTEGSRSFNVEVRVDAVRGGQSPTWRILFDLTPGDVVEDSVPPTRPHQDSPPVLAANAGPADNLNHLEVLLQEQERRYGEALQDLREAQELLATELEISNEELRATNAELASAHQGLVTANAALETSRDMLRERFAFISAILDTVGAPIMVLDRDSKILQCNHACEAITGRTSHDARDVSLFELIPPEERASLLMAQQELLDGAVKVRRVGSLINTSGDRRQISWIYTALRSSNGAVVSFIATGLDITEQLRTEKALQASEAKFRAIVETAGEAILGVNSTGRIAMVNPAAERLFGYPPGQLSGVPLISLIPTRHRVTHEREHKEYFEAPVVRRMASGITVTGLRRDGSEVPLDISLSYAETDQGLLAVAIAQDVSERIESRRRLQLLARSLLYAQEEERRRIARDLHDEVTQAIALIGIKIGFAIQKLEGPSAELLSDLDGAREAVAQLSEEVRSLSHRLHPSALDFTGLLPAIEALVADTRQIDGPRVCLTIGRVDEDIPSDISAVLYRVTQEALRNARKHSQADRIDIEISSSDGLVRISVRDNGQGFDVSRARTGSGLGLISMEERVLGVQGNFKLESAPGKGTCLVVTVPTNHSAAEHSPAINSDVTATQERLDFTG